MSKQAYREKCEAVEASFKDSGKRDGRGYRMLCPYCTSSKTGRPDHSMAMNGDGLFHCHRCGTGGKLREGPNPGAIEDDIVDAIDEGVEPPEGFIALGYDPGLTAYVTEDARTYALKRGITPELARELQVGCVLEGYYAGRLVLPMFVPGNEDRKWSGYVTRDYTGHATKPYLYMRGMDRSQLWNHDALYNDTDSPLLIVEGILDCIPFYPNASALLGKPSIQQREAMLTARRPLAIVLDGDAHTEAHALALWLRIQGVDAGCVRLPARVDPDEVDKATLLNACIRCLSSLIPVML